MPKFIRENNVAIPIPSARNPESLLWCMKELWALLKVQCSVWGCHWQRLHLKTNLSSQTWESLLGGPNLNSLYSTAGPCLPFPPGRGYSLKRNHPRGRTTLFIFSYWILPRRSIDRLTCEQCLKFHLPPSQENLAKEWWWWLFFSPTKLWKSIWFIYYSLSLNIWNQKMCLKFSLTCLFSFHLLREKYTSQVGDFLGSFCS